MYQEDRDSHRNWNWGSYETERRTGAGSKKNGTYGLYGLSVERGNKPIYQSNTSANLDL